MSKTINVSVKKKIAVQTNDVIYICGNSDYVVDFDFDDEWLEHGFKTARFVYEGKYTDVVFEGNQCSVPVISNTYNIKVGVFAGDLRTSTPANISAKKSILCGGGTPEAPTPDVYNQMMELFNAEMGAVEQELNEALAKAKESGEFDGKDGVDGKDGYTPVKGVDYFDGKDGRDGVDGKDGKDGVIPEKGVDYFTLDDIQEVVDATKTDLQENCQIGYTEPNRVYTFDGNPEGHITDGNLVKISDDRPNYYDLISITVYADNGGEITYYKENNELSSSGMVSENQYTIIIASNSHMDIRDDRGFYAFEVRSDGLYAYTRPDLNNWYASRIEYDGIVHTVKPEYIPEEITKGVMPTAKLVTEFWDEEGEIELPPEDCDALNAAVAPGAPVIVAAYFYDNTDGETMYLYVPFAISYESPPSEPNTAVILKATIGTTRYSFFRNEYNWIVQIKQLAVMQS